MGTNLSTLLTSIDCYPDDPDIPKCDERHETTYVLPLGSVNPTNPIVYMDIEIAGKVVIGRIECELKVDVVPQTVENFRALCTGDNPRGLNFRGSPFHRIIPGFMCQGGDITHKNGRGGASIYGKFMDDENFILKHEGTFLN